MQQIDVLIAGGGLAGLCSAIHLVRAGVRVMLIERASFPHHKVCGEYLSVEILPYLQYLDADPSHLSSVRITELECSASSGKKLHVLLPLGGIGISRYKFDDFLFHHALAQGVQIIQDQVDCICRKQDYFDIGTRSGKRFSAPVVLGAFGKRSSLDLNRGRRLRRGNTWLALKGSTLYPKSKKAF
jgi:flavin-dependent dehydrogenase